MRPEDFLDFISPDEIRVKGHRVWLEHILAYYLDGESVTDIVTQLPTLSIDEVRAVIAYYETHRQEVDAYLTRDATDLAEQLRAADAATVPSVVARLRRLRDALKAEGAQEALAKSERP